MWLQKAVMVLYLRYVEGLRRDEVAERMGISTKAVTDVAVKAKKLCITGKIWEV